MTRARIAALAGSLLAIVLVTSCAPPPPRGPIQLTDEACTIQARAGSAVPFAQARQITPPVEGDDPCGPITVEVRVRVSTLRSSSDWAITCDVKSPGVPTLNRLWSSTVMMTTPPVAQCVKLIEGGQEWTQVNVTSPSNARTLSGAVTFGAAGGEPTRYIIPLGG